MYYDVNDILAKLQGGEDAEAIAQSFADALNAAIDQKKALDAKALQKKREAEKINSLQCIIDELLDWVGDYYQNIAVDDIEIDAAEMVKVFDEAERTAGALKKSVYSQKGSIDEAAEKIREFLRKNNL